MPQPELIGRPGVETAGRLTQGQMLLGIGNGRGNRDRHRLGDLILHCEDVGEVAVVALSPDVLAGLGLDELRGDADPIADFAQAALEHIPHTQLAPDLLHIDSAALVGKAGIAGDDEQRGVARQRGDDVLGDPIGEKLLLGVTAHIGEGQHRDRGLVWQRERSGPLARLSDALGRDAEDMHWPGNVLELRLADVLGRSSLPAASSCTRVARALTRRCRPAPPSLRAAPRCSRRRRRCRRPRRRCLPYGCRPEIRSGSLLARRRSAPSSPPALPSRSAARRRRWQIRLKVRRRWS
jgi:hypothetical protein